MSILSKLGLSSNGKSSRVLWVDSKEWDIADIPLDKVAGSAKLVEFAGEQVYLTERQCLNDSDYYKEYNYKVFDVPEVADNDISPAKLYRATRWPLIAKVWLRKFRRDEAFDKKILIAFIGCAFIFLFFVLVILLG